MKTMTNACSIISAILLAILLLGWMDICASNTSPNREPSKYNVVNNIITAMDEARAE